MQHLRNQMEHPQVYLEPRKIYQPHPIIKPLLESETKPILFWEIIDHAASYRNGSKSCNLCLAEKVNIITSKREFVNTKSELISKCRHVNKFLSENYQTVPPDG
eukprot:TCONS_00015874-protein